MNRLLLENNRIYENALLSELIWPRVTTQLSVHCFDDNRWCFTFARNLIKEAQFRRLKWGKVPHPVGFEPTSFW